MSVWPVGFTGAFKWAGPICKNGKVMKFWTLWKPYRRFPVDMAGFALNVNLLLDKPKVFININAPIGFLETNLLESLVSIEELEPLANDCTKVSEHY